MANLSLSCVHLLTAFKTFTACIHTVNYQFFFRRARYFTFLCITAKLDSAKMLVYMAFSA